MVAKLAMALGVMGSLAVLSGCSIRIQAPVREVAYDFSDRDFYDRSYAPSPAYAPSPEAYAHPRAEGATPRHDARAAR